VRRHDFQLQNKQKYFDKPVWNNGDDNSMIQFNQLMPSQEFVPCGWLLDSELELAANPY
jgi:hypothetical protein